MPSHKQRAFLAAYAECGTITAAAKAAGCDRSSHYKWLEDDPGYPDRFQEATDEAVECLIDEARRRAVEGVPEPVGWYQGKPGGTVQRYSDNLLMFLIKAMRPEYRDGSKINVGAVAATGDVGLGEKVLADFDAEYKAHHDANAKP